jgi:hypothetical protein
MCRTPHVTPRARRRPLIGATVATLLGCGEGVQVGEQRGAATADGAAGGAGACVVAECLGHVYQCGDCLDNDGDGAIDESDTDCLGACDNTEDSYHGGIPGQNNAVCVQDCYFDHDTGPGNDGCRWSHACDARSVAPDFPPSGDVKCGFDPGANVPGTSMTCTELAALQPEQCRDACGPLTPNGCDCFGCCELPAGSGRHVWLGSTANGAGSCSEAVTDDPAMCRPCTPVAACLNPCDRCELCVGKAQIPADCAPDAAADPRCPQDVESCGSGVQERCPPQHYCITGCCIPLPA